MLTLLFVCLCWSTAPHARERDRTEIPLSVQYVEISADSWPEVKWQVWHAGVRGRDGKFWPALTVFSPGLTCNGNAAEAHPRLTMQLPRKSKDTNWRVSVALRFWRLKAVFRQHELGHVRIYRAGVASCLSELRNESCDDAFRQFGECMVPVMSEHAEYEAREVARIGSI